MFRSMAEWTGDVSGDASTEGDRIVRRHIMRLITEGNCKPDIAHNVVRELIAEIADRLNRMADEADQASERG